MQIINAIRKGNTVRFLTKDSHIDFYFDFDDEISFGEDDILCYVKKRDKTHIIRKGDHDQYIALALFVRRNTNE